MTQDRDQDREAFEAWALPRGWTINRDHSDWYVDDSTSREWAIWQACAAAKDARIAQLARELDESLAMNRTLEAQRDAATGCIDALELENARLTQACSKMNDEVSQVLGKALGYPWFKDDQKNFPGATEVNGVCVGDHVAESLADEAAERISRLTKERDEARASAQQEQP